METMDFAVNPLLCELLRRERIGLVTDFDGTISAITPMPDAAQVNPASRALLLGLAGTLPLVAVITGRAVEDVRRRIGLPDLVYVGNHGMEHWEHEQHTVSPEALACRPALETVLDAVKPHLQPGVVVQDKRITVSIHYRAAADPDAARAELAPVIEQAARAGGLRLFEGKQVFEIRPDLDVDKGTALAALARDYRLDGVVYLGDDVTDADGLRRARELRGGGTCWAVGIGVTSEDTPAAVRESADLFAAGIPGVEAFLRWLAHAVGVP
jgi:trehalose 6-phosphate phosphatase